MIVNGVTLPDIPAEVLETYPYLTCITLLGEGTLLVASTQKAAFYDTAEITGTYGIAIFSDTDGTATVYGLESGATEWVEDGEPTTNGITFWLHEVGLTDNSTFYPNHDICIATEFDNSTGKVTVGIEVWKAAVEYKFEEEPKPTRVSIGRSLVDGYAREVQRLTGTTDQMNAVQIRDKLATVKAGIKIGDTVLPAIPEDVLAEYPYAMIGLNSDYNMYLLGVSDTPFAYLPAELTTTGNAFITTVGFRHKFYAYDGSAWVFQNENSTERIYQELNETIGVCWANDDICTITSRTDAQGEITVGTEVYFSERQNFNGVWLPKIPEDVLKQYPYNVILKISRSGMSVYMLAGLTEELTFAPKEIAATVVECDGILYTKQPCTITSFMYTGAGNWLEQGVSNNDTFKVHVGMTDISYDVFWCNSDVCIATAYDTATNIATIGTELYFPPLPAIDTDRVSIGYDLCDGIVEEVQRLSGDQEKMDALHAYWKLTTVVSMAAPSGGIVIDGVKLPEIPADVLASYPYCSILGMNGQYMLIGTQSKQVIGLGTGSGNGGYENDYIRTVEPSGYVMYGYGGEFTDWTLQNQSESFGALEFMTPIPFVWANHDLYTWVYSVSDNEWIMDEIYFLSSI